VMLKTTQSDEERKQQQQQCNDDAAAAAAAAADRRRELHLQSEQKRRDSIKLGYERLSEQVQSGGGTSDGGGKGAALSKATILQRSIRHMESLNRQRELQETELDCLKKQVAALQVIEESYRQLLASGRLTSSLSAAAASVRVPDSVKLAVFRSVMDELFDSFNSATGDASSFVELSGRSLAWLEHSCQPSAMRDLCDRVVRRVLAESNLSPAGGSALTSQSAL
ncbi:hypothetical protein BOX15_Mlig005845g1, partial [Macrostomum lignano]